MIISIDEQTMRLYEVLKMEEELRTPGMTSLPLFKFEMSMEETNPYWFRRLYMTNQNLKMWADKYWDGGHFHHSDCYRCLAYRIYGYGYMSNNERRMAGLKPRRVRRRR